MEKEKSPLQILRAVMRVIVPLGLIVFLGWQVDWSQILPLLAQVSWPLLLASLALFTLSQTVIAVRWDYLLRFQGLRIPFSRLFWLVFVGAFSSNFLPTTIGGDVVKAYGVMLGQERRGVAAGSVIVDRLFNLVSMLLLTPLALTLTGLPIGFALASFWVPAREKLDAVWKTARIWFLSPRCWLTALPLSWLSVGLAFGSFWAVILATGVRVTYWQAAAISVLSYLVALVPVAVNGLGIMEGSIAYLLTLQGATLEQGLAAAVLVRMVNILVSLLGGGRLLFGWQDLLSRARQSEQSSS